MESIYIFYILLFIVAFLYSSVGHGGASGYLALMAIYAISPEVMKPTALLLNLFVSLTSFYQFYRGKHFKWNIFLPLAIASVPMAFAGGLISIEADFYKKILGYTPAHSGDPLPFLCQFPNRRDQEEQSFPVHTDWLIHWIFIRLIGIGGGIILSPVLLLLKWTDQKQTAAISALFIFVNSFSGLAGHLSKGIQFSPDMISYVAIAFAGGLCGSYFGSLKFNQNILKNTLAIVLLLAGIKLIFT
jgi:uncharacterized membrane protein YfcA